ncbi:MAG: RNA polymerase sigma factor [Ilumatobacter sp.]
MNAVLQDDAVEPALVTADGFDGFFRAHHGEVVTALSLAIGDDDLGRDAAAEGFTRALQRWNKVSRYSNPTGWVYRVGLNWARSRRRKTVREVASSTAAASEPVARSVEADPQLAEALDKLGPDHRAVVVARFYLDWSEHDIATALGIRAGTVKSRLSRALERLAVDLRSP